MIMSAPPSFVARGLPVAAGIMGNRDMAAPVSLELLTPTLSKVRGCLSRAS